MAMVHSLKNRVEVDDETHGRDSLEEGMKMMEKELGELIEKVNIVEMKKMGTKEKELESLGLVRKEEERKHLKILISFQKKIIASLAEISSFQSISLPTSETVPEVTLNRSPLHPLLKSSSNRDNRLYVLECLILLHPTLCGLI